MFYHGAVCLTDIIAFLNSNIFKGKSKRGFTLTTPLPRAVYIDLTYIITQMRVKSFARGNSFTISLTFTFFLIYI